MKTNTIIEMTSPEPAAPDNRAADGAASRLQVFVDVVEPGWVDAACGAALIAETCARAAFTAAGAAAATGGFCALVPVPGADRLCDVSIVLADDDRVAALNREYRGKDGPTNVLSFPATGGPLPDDLSMPVLLGDVVIAFGVCQAEAEAAGVTITNHLSHLVVHGMLHLLGWDHETDAEAGRMETLETDILKDLNIPDPYQRP